MRCSCPASGHASSNSVRPGYKIAIAGVMTAACLGFALAATGISSFAQQDTAGMRMTRAAKDWIDSLDADQKKAATFAFTDKERSNWNFVPLQDKERKPTRKGLRLELMTDSQKDKAMSLLRTGTSDRGYQAALATISLESVLARMEKPGGNVRTSGWYFVSIFGEPGSEAGWGWRFEGHHLALNFSLRGTDVTGTTPAFFGANPAEVRSGAEKGRVALEGCSALALKLIAALSPEQTSKASAAKPSVEVDQGQTKPPALTGAGITADSLTMEQGETLTKLLRDYTGRLPAELEARELALIQGYPRSDLRFEFFRDPAAKGKPMTYRIEAPGFLIQYLNVQADGEGNPANHIHSAYRRVAGDFGQPAR